MVNQIGKMDSKIIKCKDNDYVKQKMAIVE